MSHIIKTHTENIILQAWASIKIITGGPLLEATRVRKSQAPIYW